MKNMKQFICMLALVATVYEINAQQVQELGSRLASMRESSDAAVKAEADQLNSLAYDAKPTLYCQNGLFVGTVETIPVRLITDVASLRLLNVSNSLYSQVQIICIRIENLDDLKVVLDLSALAGFSKLKCVYFLCSFKICNDQEDISACEMGKISAMLRGNTNPAIKILYTSTINE